MVDLMTFSFCHSERSEESVLKLMVDSNALFVVRCSLLGKIVDG